MNATQPLAVGDPIEGQMIQVYVVTRNPDTVEGRGKTIDHSLHLHEADALLAASGVDVGGQDGKVEPRLVLRLRDGRHFQIVLDPISFELISDKQKLEHRQKALKKLNRADLVALGIHNSSTRP